MSHPIDRDDRLVAYLLDRLLEPEATEIEERLFADDDFEERLAATQDDLIHAYLDGELPLDDRARLERHVLQSPEGQARLSFLRNLGAAAHQLEAEKPEKTSDRPAWRRPAFAFSLAAALACVVFLWPVRQPTRPAVGPRQNDRPATPPTTLAAAAATSTPVAPQPLSVRVNVPRGATEVTADLTSATSTLRVQVAIGKLASAPSLDATILDSASRVIWKAESLEPPAPGASLAVEMPVAVFGSGEDFRVRIEAEPNRDGEALRPNEFRLRLRRR